MQAPWRDDSDARWKDALRITFGNTGGAPGVWRVLDAMTKAEQEEDVEAETNGDAAKNNTNELLDKDKKKDAELTTDIPDAAGGEGG